MSRSVPEFAVGEALTADKMKDLLSAVGELQQAGTRRGGQENAPARCRPRMRHSFEAAVRGGVLYIRRGYVDFGNGKLVAAGDAEWNAVCGLSACTVWLVLTASETAKLVVTPYDEETASTSTRRRIASVRTDEDGGIRLMQHWRGILCPLHAFRARAGEAETDGQSQYLPAGGMYGKGTISSQRPYRAALSFGYIVGDYWGSEGYAIGTPNRKSGSYYTAMGFGTAE